MVSGYLLLTHDTLGLCFSILLYGPQSWPAWSMPTWFLRFWLGLFNGETSRRCEQVGGWGTGTCPLGFLLFVSSPTTGAVPQLKVRTSLQLQLFPHLCLLPSPFPIWKYHPLATRILEMQPSIALSPPFFPMLSQAQTDSVLTYPSVHSDPGRMDTRCQRHQWIRCRMSFLLCRQSSSMPGDFSFLPRSWHNLWLHTSALVFCLASWLPMGVESSPDLFFFPPPLFSLSLFFFLTQSPVSCFSLCWTLSPETGPSSPDSQIFWGMLFEIEYPSRCAVILLFVLPDPSSPFSTLNLSPSLTPILTYVDPPTDPCFPTSSWVWSKESPGGRSQGGTG